MAALDSGRLFCPPCRTFEMFSPSAGPGFGRSRHAVHDLPDSYGGSSGHRKLGGSAANLTTYTILINLVTALIVPIFVPLIHPHPDLTFGVSFSLILSKVFPLLFCPFLAALFVRYCLPGVHKLVVRCKDLAFYLWAVALAIAIGVTVKSIVHSEVSVLYQLGIAGISLVCCVVQFWAGKRIGTCYNDSISAGQALGQKNTVFAIWMGYTFMTPVTSVAGGFYSIWHNIYNSYQLYRKRNEENK